MTDEDFLYKEVILLDGDVDRDLLKEFKWHERLRFKLLQLALYGIGLKLQIALGKPVAIKMVRNNYMSRSLIFKLTKDKIMEEL